MSAVGLSATTTPTGRGGIDWPSSGRPDHLLKR